MADKKNNGSAPADVDKIVVGPQITTRILGSRPHVDALRTPLLPRRPKNGPPDGNGNGKTKPPPISAPDLGLEFTLGEWETLLGFVGPDARQKFIDQMSKTLKQLPILKNGEIRSADDQGTVRIGVWSTQAASPGDAAARDRGYHQLGILKGNENVALLYNFSTIKAFAQSFWDAMPKRIDDNTHNDPNGPIHLTGFSTSVNPPNQIVSTITGFDDRPFPDVDFTLTVTETLVISGQQVQVQSASELHADLSWIHFLTGVSLVLSTIDWVFLIPAAFFGTESIIGANIPTSSVPNQAIAGAIKQLFVSEIPVAAPAVKIAIQYDRIEVGAGGAAAGGNWTALPRVPSVRIEGLGPIAINEGEKQVTCNFTVRTVDMVPPLDITITAAGAAQSYTLDNTVDLPTSVQFNIGGAKGGDVLTEKIDVTVEEQTVQSDNTKMKATTESTVKIYTIVGKDDGDGIPKVCRVKPWLPECDVPMAEARERRARKR